MYVIVCLRLMCVRDCVFKANVCNVTACILWLICVCDCVFKANVCTVTACV